ncbi:hypothetical protein N2152v2_007103 [Parachlorella kessleri]
MAELSEAPPWEQRRAGAGDGEGRERLTTHDALSYLRDVKLKFANNRRVYDSFLEIMKQFKANQIDTAGVIEKVKELFKGHDELILGFNTFLPKGYEIKVDGSTTTPETAAAQAAPKPSAAPKPPVEFDQAITYVNKIKQRFANDERVYKAFLEILNMYRKGMKTIANVYEEVALLFRNHDDLLREFTYFLPDNTPPAAKGATRQGYPRKLAGAAGYGAGKQHQRKPPAPLRRDDPKVQRELAFFDKVKARLRSREAYADFLKCLNLFAEDVLSKSELVSLVHDMLGKQSDLMAGFNEFLMRCEIGPEDPYSRQYAGRDKQRSQMDKWIRSSISELDVSTWDRATPSYVLLPANYPKLKATGRNELGQLIFNEDWVSVTSGSEDYSFKHYRKNQYEEALFRAEDDHFELDLLIEQCSSAIHALQPLARELEELGDAEERNSWQLPELRAFHYRAVQRIYGEQGNQMLRLLREHPAVTLPVVLQRLQQKDAEWRRVRGRGRVESKGVLSVAHTLLEGKVVGGWWAGGQVKAEMMVTWQTIFKENYHKSLDHRSFYFKQTDKKLLTHRSMVQEIKDAAEKKRQERGAVLQAVSGRADFAARLQPHLAFDFSDMQVHEDACAVIQMGIDTQATREHGAKLRQLFHVFLETFFEVPCSCAAAEERRKISPMKDPSPGMRRGRKAKSAPSSTDVNEDANTEDVGPQRGAKGETEADTGTEAETSDSEEEEEEGLGAAMSEEPSSMSDDEDQTSFRGCKPVVPLIYGGPPAAPPTPEPSAAAPAGAGAGPLRAHCRLLYCNEQLYVLLRLHQYIYDRLRVARQCALDKGKQASFHRGGEVGQGPNEEVWVSAARTVHGQFMDMVTDLLEGRLDVSNFEDNCRALLGTNSYVLFTLDKLVSKTVKQLQVVHSDEVAARLVELWRYENARGVPVHDPVYHANAHVILHEEPCYRVEHTLDRKVSVQLMDPDKMDVPPGILETAFHTYVKGYVDRPVAPGVASEGSPDAGRVCLLRNLANAAHGSEVDDEALLAALDGAQVVNGLECKLCSAQQKIKKIAYVLGTEDYFYRKRDSASAAASSERAAERSAQKLDKFRNWLEAQAMPPPQAAAAAQQQQQAAFAAIAAASVPYAAQQQLLQQLQQQQQQFGPV